MRDSARVWKAHFGRHVANQLKGATFESFALLRCLDLEIAIPARRVDEFRAAVKADGPATHVEDTGRRVVGYRIAGQAPRLDAADFHAALQAIAAERERFEQERDQRAKAKALQVAAARQQAEEQKRYGAPVPAATDDE